MASKKLGSAVSVATVPSVVYTVPALKSAVFNLNICNTGTEVALVTVSIGGDIIEYNTAIAIGGVLERTSLIASAAEAVTLTSDKSSVVIRAYGMEE